MAKIHAPDYKFIGTVILMIVVGLVVLSSASSVLGYDRFGDTFYYVKHQLLYGLFPGIFALLVLSRVDYHIWRKASFWLLLISIGLLLAVFIPGVGSEFGGSRSWIVIGGFSLQPSEIVKLIFVLYLASWLEKRSHGIKDMFYGLIPFALLLGMVAGLIILQPDIGTVSIIIVMSIVVYFAAGAPLRHLFALGVLGVAGVATLIKVAPYRLARWSAFLDPELDPQNTGYHIKQALLAIGSGGFFGLGLGRSRQKFAYLPEAAGDSIFAIAAEELGFIFSLVLIALLVYFIHRGIRISRYAPDTFGRLIAVGVVSWLGWQAVVNIGAMVGLMPLTGIPLPFISYGGTALMTSLAAVGIVINISKQTGERVRHSNLRQKWRRK